MPQDTRLPFRAALPWIGLLTLIFWCIFSSRAMLAPLLVAVETDLGVGHAESTSLLLMQSVGFSFSLMLCGPLLSHIRPSYLVFFSVAGGGLGLTLMPLAATLNEARFGFLAFGLAVGFYFPAALTTLSSITHPKDWGKTLGIHELAPPLAFLLTPLLVQFGLNFTSWQGVLACEGAGMIVAGLVFLRWGRGGRSCAPPPSFAGCRNLVANPVAWLTALLIIMGMLGEFSVYSVLQIYLVDVDHFDPATANFILALTRLVAPVAVVAGGFAADRIDLVGLLRACFLVHAASLALMALDQRLFNLTGIVLQSVSIALVFAPIYKLVPLHFSPAMQPLLLSLSIPLGGVFSAGLVPMFLGWCGQQGRFDVGFLCLALASALCALAVRLLKPFPQSPPTRQA